ncbi:MAG: ATP-binding protein [Lachnospiraceae bacterium]|nr:ATP-binding protein [Lachnospiraceae bacterium]
MLCQFTVKNYKSIRDEATFDMQAAAISEHNDKVIVGADGQLFLPVSVIYGPNGGGKSNVLEAIHTLDSKVLRPLCATCDKSDCDYKVRKIPVEPFAFSEINRKMPTEFELFFRTETAEYRYILRVQEEIIIYESLDRVKMDTGRRSALFLRNSEGIELKGTFGKFKISEDLSETLPLLSYLGITYKKNEIVNDVLGWFEDSIDFLNYGNPYQELRTAIARSEEVRTLVLKMLREMNLDIEDFRIEERDEDHIEVYTQHIVEGYSTELVLSEESSGTRKLFGLLPYIAKSLVCGTTLVIDELDAKIHPLLLQHIIEMFTDMAINRHGAQLIFTSHDLSTMNNHVFRRDEIWFVAKGRNQNSKLYSLVEFKDENGVSIRKDAKFDKQYLEGKYGADPYLQRIIDWGNADA